MLPVLYIVIPCYNEEEVLPLTAPTFRKKLRQLIEEGKIYPSSKILFVNDGSKDGTWDVIQKLSEEDSCYKGISLSRNRGHQNALLAGLMEAKNQCDITISIDCDLQDDVNAMDEMINAYEDGCEVVYGVRASRKTDTFFKRFTAQSFYRVLTAMGAEVVYNHADYRLISSRVLKEFSNFKEVNLFLRGMVPLVGFKSCCVTYSRAVRVAGESHYPLKKMIALAIDGITSLSVKPLHIITGIGTFLSVSSFLVALCTLIAYMRGGQLNSMLMMAGVLCFVSGIQLVCLGVVGEYVGKIYMESKHRPRYIVSDRTGKKSDSTKSDTTKTKEKSYFDHVAGDKH